MLQASCGMWHDAQLRPFVPCGRKKWPVRSIAPCVLNVPARPLGFRNVWLLESVVSDCEETSESVVWA